MNLENSIETFIKEQAEETEQKGVGVTQPSVEVGSDSQQAAVVSTDDFETPPVPEVDDLGSEPAKQEPVIPYDPRKEAAIVATLIDITQRTSLTGVHKFKTSKKIGGRDNWNDAIKLMDEIEEGDSKFKDLTKDEKYRVTQVKRTITKIQRLPLTQEEKDLWVDALESMMAENNYKMPPMVLLVIALVNMIVPRTLDLYLD